MNYDWNTPAWNSPEAVTLGGIGEGNTIVPQVVQPNAVPGPQIRIVPNDPTPAQGVVAINSPYGYAAPQEQKAFQAFRQFAQRALSFIQSNDPLVGPTSPVPGIADQERAALLARQEYRNHVLLWGGGAVVVAAVTAGVVYYLWRK